MKKLNSLRDLAVVLLVAGWAILASGDAYAQNTVVNPPVGTPPVVGAAGGKADDPVAGGAAGKVPSDALECTTSAAFNEAQQSGMLTNVTTKIVTIIRQASQKLYEAITGKGTGGNNAFINAIYAAMVLYIVIYGIMFMLGMANLTLGEVIVRLMKIGFIMAIVSDGGWDLFNNVIRNFFENGTNEIINEMSYIMANATGNVGHVRACLNSGVDGSDCVLRGLDRSLTAVFSMHMFVGILGSVKLLPYGPPMVLLLTYGIWQFLRAIFEAVWVFLMSMIGRALLFGLAPIFISCLMFQKTKTLFDGWLNQLVNFSLQPIFLFAFLGFYTDLVEQSLRAILDVHWCWTAGGNAGAGNMSTWVTMTDGTAARQEWTALGPVLYDAAGNVIEGDKADKVFPLNVVDVLIFALLAQLAWRYTQVVVGIAREIAGSVVSLTNMSGALTGWFQNAGAQFGQGAKGFLSGATVNSRGISLNTTGGAKGGGTAMRPKGPGG